MILRRHDLVDVAPETWRAATVGIALPTAAAACVAGWVERGRSAIVRRRLASDEAGTVPLAIQLPNAFGRLRLTVAVPPSAIGPRAPVTLADVASSAPPDWTGTIESVLSLSDEFGRPRVYGGLLWQHLTGEPVLRETSDLDLLWHPAADRRAALVQALAALDGIPRLDGEIVLADGAGVSWRELHAAMEGRAHSVAAKTLDGVALRDAGAILCKRMPW